MDFNGVSLDFLFVLVSILIITILIVVHEFGHFLAARYFGFQTPIFGIGLPFGPHIDLFKKWNTQFRFHWFLIGGFVSIPELGDETNPELLKELNIKEPLRHFPVWQRAIVASGGIVFNILFAFLLCVVMSATIGLPKAAANNSIGDFVKGNPIAQKAGIIAGDRIIFVGESKVETGIDLKEALESYKSARVLLTVQRELKSADDKTEIAEEDKVFETKKIYISPNEKGAIGVVLGYEQEYVKNGNNPLVWLWDSAKFTGMTLLGMFISVIGILVTLFTKIFSIFLPAPLETGVALDQVKGIVGIVQLISEDIQSNWAMVYQFAILLSLNLAVINVLPIPALDGGHLMFMLYEAIAGKKPNEKMQENAVQFGFLFLLTVIALTTVNDIKHWIFG